MTLLLGALIAVSERSPAAHRRCSLSASSSSRRPRRLRSAWRWTARRVRWRSRSARHR